MSGHVDLEISTYFENFAKTFNVADPAPARFSLDPLEHFTGKLRVKRSGCPGGVGNLGFNSFNFMTFILLTLNAVANTNNNINNNNNNNIDINYNTINQDSNNVISNSENMNTIMAVILPAPGRSLFNRTKRSADKTNRSADKTNRSADMTNRAADKTNRSADKTNRSADMNKRSADMTKRSDDMTKRSDDMTNRSADLSKRYMKKAKIPENDRQNSFLPFSPFIQNMEDSFVVNGNLEMNMMKDAVEQMKWILAGEENCEGWRICKAIQQFSARYLKDALNTELLEHNLNPCISLTNCDNLFPEC